MRYYIVDAFTEKPFGGNTAGVVLIEDGKEFPSDEFMQQVAAEFRYSETAFVKRHTSLVAARWTCAVMPPSPPLGRLANRAQFLLGQCASTTLWLAT